MISNVTNSKNELCETVRLTSFKKTHNCKLLQFSSSLFILAFFCIYCCVLYTFLSCFERFFYVRGTQRKDSSKPLKHSIVKRILVRQIWAYFIPKKFFICSDYLAESLVIRRLQGSKLTFRKFQPEYRLPKIRGDLLRVKIR